MHFIFLLIPFFKDFSVFLLVVWISGLNTSRLLLTLATEDIEKLLHCPWMLCSGHSAISCEVQPWGSTRPCTQLRGLSLNSYQNCPSLEILKRQQLVFERYLPHVSSAKPDQHSCVPTPSTFATVSAFTLHGLLHRVQSENTYHLQECYDHFLLTFYAIKWNKLWWNVIIQMQQQNEADSKHDLTTECVENTPSLSANSRKVVDNLCHSIQSFWSHTLFMEKVINLCLLKRHIKKYNVKNRWHFIGDHNYLKSWQRGFSVPKMTFQDEMRKRKASLRKKLWKIPVHKEGIYL